MPAHDVTMNLSHPITVKNVDVEFEVRSDGELMGKVQISKGGIDWTPFKSHPRTATWEQLRCVDGGIRLGDSKVVADRVLARTSHSEGAPDRRGEVSPCSPSLSAESKQGRRLRGLVPRLRLSTKI